MTNTRNPITFFCLSPLLILLLGAACISIAPILVRVSEVGPLATAFYRCLLSLPVFAIWLLLERRGSSSYRKPVGLKDYGFLCAAGFLFCGDIGFWHISIALTTIAKSTLLVNLSPIFVTLGAYLFFSEKFSVQFLIGMALAMTGMIILLGESITLNSSQIAGDLQAVIAAVFYGGYLLLVGRLRNNFSTVTIMIWSSIVTSILLVPVMLASGENIIVMTVQGWTILIILALVSHVLGQGLITHSLAHLNSAMGAVGLLLQPVLSAILAWFIFNEFMSPVQLTGCLIVLSGIYFARRGTVAK